MRLRPDHPAFPQVTGRAYVDHPILFGFEPVWQAYTGLLVLEHFAHYAAERSGSADRPGAAETGAAGDDHSDQAPLQPWAEWAWGKPTPLSARALDQRPKSAFTSAVYTIVCITLFLCPIFVTKLVLSAIDGEDAAARRADIVPLVMLVSASILLCGILERKHLLARVRRAVGRPPPPGGEAVEAQSV
jgi:hypothetical protein